ncbi:MAG: glycosyltransferase [Candidatus Methanomethylicaceae archaeon]
MRSHPIIYLTPFSRVDIDRRESFAKNALKKYAGIDIKIYTLRDLLIDNPPLRYLSGLAHRFHFYSLSRFCNQISLMLSLKKLKGLRAAICLNTITLQMARKALGENVPLILDYMDVFLKANGSLTRYEEKTIAKADLIIFWSKALKELLNKIYGSLIKKSEYIPFGIDLKKFDEYFTAANPLEFRKRYDLRNYDFVITYSGGYWLFHKKEAHGLFELIPALKIIASRIPHVKFIFQGIDITKSAKSIEFYKAIKENALLEKTLFLPFMSQYDNLRMSLLKTSNILLLPSSNWPTIAYAEQMKLFEYMAAARPIVAHEVPGLRSVLDNSTAFFCKVGNIEDLATTIVDIYEGPDEACRKAEKARIQVIQNYDWKILAPKYAKIVMDTFY